MSIEQNLQDLDHRGCILRTAVYPGHLVCESVQGTSQDYGAPILLPLRKSVRLALTDKGTATILLDPQGAQFVDEEKQLTLLQILERMQDEVHLLSVVRIR